MTPAIPAANDWRENSLIVSVRLPDGSGSGGVLIEEQDELVLVLFDERELSIGDELVLPYDDTRVEVVDVDRGTMEEQRVTVAKVQRREPQPRG